MVVDDNSVISYRESERERKDKSGYKIKSEKTVIIIKDSER